MIEKKKLPLYPNLSDDAEENETRRELLSVEEKVTFSNPHISTYPYSTSTYYISTYFLLRKERKLRRRLESFRSFLLS